MSPESEGAERRSRNWQGIAALVTALLAVAGFLWNKAEAYLDRASATEVQRVSYDTLAATLQDLALRIAVLERTCKPADTDTESLAEALARKLREMRAARREAKPTPTRTESDEVPAVEWPPLAEVTDTDTAGPAPREKSYPAAGLPPFQAIQRRAVTLE